MYLKKIFLTIILLSLMQYISAQVITGGVYIPVNNKPKQKSKVNNTINNEKPKVKLSELPSKARKYTKDFKYIPGGMFTMGTRADIAPSGNDTSLVAQVFPVGLITMESFYISDHEVTNAEYRDFVNWVRDSLARRLLADNGDITYLAELSDEEQWKRMESDSNWVYQDPNTGLLNWKKKIDWEGKDPNTFIVLRPLYCYTKDRISNEFHLDIRKLIFKYGDTFTSVYPDTSDFENKYSKHGIDTDYFINPKYDSYPVIGLSFEQTKAYANWLTLVVNRELQESGKKLKYKLSFSLPTEAQWEYAANADTAYNLYGWGNNTLTNKKGQYYANFGHIYDINELVIKNSEDDGHKLIAQVKSYKPNKFGLYDMSGNVSEWVRDVFRTITPTIPDNISSKYRKAFYKTIITKDDDLKSALFKIAERNELERQANNNSYSLKKEKDFSYLQNILKRTKQELHDVKLFEKENNLRIIKGGSWLDTPVYMQIGSKEVAKEKAFSAKTGFRVILFFYDN